MIRTTLTLSALVVCAGVAQAEVFTWNWNSSMGGGSINNAAGKFESITAKFDSTAQTLSWDMTFSDQIADGYSLVLNNGPNPKGHAGELAVIYYDWSNKSNDPRVTAYAYNGQNITNSWQDGNGQVAGNQSPDLIHSIGDSSWITNASASNQGGKRIMNLTIDTTTINGWDPKYPGSTDWYGIGFAEKLGLWLHTFDGLTTSYDSKCKLTKWTYKKEGWFDGNNFPTVVPLPAPVAMGLAGLFGVAVVRRRMAR